MSLSAADATNPRNFAWVSANAGSGKTRLLTDRVTRLLLHGASVSRVLCLTYTKAAAAEMASRLFARLGAWALLPDDELLLRLTETGASAEECHDLRRARRLFALALEAPGGLKIQTIHAFCQHLLARFPVEAGIPARFSVLDERDSAELLAQAQTRVLENSSCDPALSNAISVLAARASDIRFAEILESAIAGRSKLMHLLSRHGDKAAELFRHIRKQLDVAEGVAEAQITEAICREVAAEEAQLQRAAQRLAAGSKADNDLAERIAAFLRSGMTGESYRLLKNIFFTTEHSPRANMATKQMQDKEPALIAWLDAIKDRVSAADDHVRRVATVCMTEALLRTAFAVFDHYDEAKRARAALDYDDLIGATIRLLETGDAASWVLYKLDGGIDHILVDEGQDTSRDQWRIIARLADEFFDGIGSRPETTPRRLFVVGDEKQSIFSFQGAEPAAFGEYRNVFRKQADSALLPFIDYRPTISRRSADSILRFVDAIFESDTARDGLTATLDPIHHDAERKEIGRVEIWPWVPAPPRVEQDPQAPVDAPVAGAHSVLAARVAERIHGWLRGGASLPGAGPITPGDIMILVRRRNAFAEQMIRELLDRGVAVAGADRMVLSEQIAVLDLIAMGNFVLLPEDDLNLAALLKSPIAGLGEDDLYDLAQSRTGSLWDELCTRAGERDSFREAHGLLSRALSDADRTPPFEFYSRILNRGARKRLVARMGMETADAIDEFMALALAHEGAHSPSLQSFLHWFGEGRGDVKRDMEQGGGAVRVMTVHGAKGLEAKVVILPDTVQIPDHERRGNILYTGNCALFGMPKQLECTLLGNARAHAHAQELREYRRLLYVAATRARDMLVVCGYQVGNRKEPPPEAWYALIARGAKKLARPQQIDGETVMVIGVDLEQALSNPQLTSHAELPEFLRQAAKPERLPLLLQPSRAAGAEEPPPISPVAGGPQRFRRGLLLHALFAALPGVDPSDRQRAGEAYLRRRGVSEPDAKLLLAEVQQVLGDHSFAPLFDCNSRAEVPISVRLPELGNVELSGQIDRLVVTADSVLIADFKTNREAPATVEEIPKLYRVQMALYRAALQKIYPGKRVDCALIWTDSARLMSIPTETLDAEMQSLVEKTASISATQAQLDRK